MQQYRVTWKFLRFFSFLLCSSIISGVGLVFSEPHHHRMNCEKSRITKQIKLDKVGLETYFIQINVERREENETKSNLISSPRLMVSLKDRVVLLLYDELSWIYGQIQLLCP